MRGVVVVVLALGGGAPASRSLCSSSSSSSVQAVGAAVHAAGRGEGRRAMGAFRRSQHGGDIEGQFGRSQLSRGQGEVGQGGARMRR